MRWNHKNPTKRIAQVQGGHHNVHCSHHDVAEYNAQLSLSNNHQSLIHLCQVKIPKRKSKIVNRRRTYNTTDKRNDRKGQTIIYRALHRKQRLSDTNSIKDRGQIKCYGSVCSS